MGEWMGVGGGRGKGTRWKCWFKFQVEGQAQSSERSEFSENFCKTFAGFSQERYILIPTTYTKYERINRYFV